MKPRIGFAALRFLRGNPLLPVRLAFAALAWPAVAIGTRAPGLAGMAAAQITGGDFLHGLRLSNWLVRRATGLGHADRSFDFTEGASAADLERLSRFLARRDDEAERAADRLLIAARRGHAALGAGDTAGFAAARGAFAAQAAVVLATRPRSAGDGGRRPGAGPAKRPAMAAAEADAALADFAEVWAGALAPARWYIISGTLLGVVREGGWLGHDVDIDLGVDVAEYDEAAVVAAFRASRAFVVRGAPPALAITRDADGRHRLSEQPGVVKLIHRSGIPIDLFVHHREGPVTWHGSTINRWDNSAFELARYRLAGLDVWGPAEADRYLSENYGQWRTPVTAFNATTGTPNIRVARNMLSVAMFLKRFAFYRRGGSAEADRLLRVMAACGAIRGQQGEERFDAGFFDG